jgi:hypothetical protein
VEGPRENTLIEKMTIRVNAPANNANLKLFVSHYSTCPHVFEIQILWSWQRLPPDESFFAYKQTHAKVSFIHVYGEDTLQSFLPNRTVETESMRFLRFSIHYIV